MATSVSSTAHKRRLKKKRQQEQQKSVEEKREKYENATQSRDNILDNDIEIEYIAAPLLPVNDGIVLEEFSNVLAKFSMPMAGAGNNQKDNDDGGEGEEGDNNDDEAMAFRHKGTAGLEQEDDSLDDEKEQGDGTTVTLSKKKLRKVNRITLAELKQYAKHPEVVGWEDVTSLDPRLLVQLKASRHSVPVPRHWIQKRKYLSGKRGYVKPPFELPAFIRDTGITELRDTMRSQDSQKRIKVKAREKMHPKLGRITVDYEKLYDAFFKYQTKPPMTIHGQLYYEGREFDGPGDRKPGFLSEDLRTALGLTTHLMPPPWLNNMQKYGPPPSYPHLRIPGLNAPIPDGAQWGYHPGGWGKPANDSFMRDMPYKGGMNDPMQTILLVPVERNLWGELEPDEEGEPGTFDENELGGENQSDEELGNPQTLDEDRVEQFEIPIARSFSKSHHINNANDGDDDDTGFAIPETPETIQVRKSRRR